jgi:NAD/NADP transhydrogenase beta subunit
VPVLCLEDFQRFMLALQHCPVCSVLEASVVWLPNQRLAWVSYQDKLELHWAWRRLLDICHHRWAQQQLLLAGWELEQQLVTILETELEPTSLPQTVAAFHSLAGIAASAAAIGDYVNFPDPKQLDAVHLASIYLATVIGSVTTTGSLVAFGKLDGRLGSAPLQLKGRDQINMGLGAATLGAGAVLMGAPEVGTGIACLGGALTTSGVLGWHMTASIGRSGHACRYVPLKAVISFVLSFEI